MVILSARFCGAAGLQNDDLRQEKIENLISRINELGFYQQPPEEIRNDPNKIKDYWPQQHRKRAKYKAQREKIQSELATMGDDAVDPIAIHCIYRFWPKLAQTGLWRYCGKRR